jgi:hypothetical protein
MLALDIFRYQITQNRVYREYCTLLGREPSAVTTVKDIPFLPVSLFKTHDIRSNVWEPDVVFESSATTRQTPGKHAVRNLDFYHANTVRGFESVTHNPVSRFRWLALLPSYTDRPASSLVSMASHFMRQGKPGSAFIAAPEALAKLKEADAGTDPVVLLTVGFALFDLAPVADLSLQNTMIIETGGMKGRRTEPTRMALHQAVRHRFGIPRVMSEYGMTELLSQAWTRDDGLFYCAPTLRVIIRDLTDPLSLLNTGERGGVNCIDLANLDTCAFIATDDLGIVYQGGGFEPLGRIDKSELRGCSLMFSRPEQMPGPSP